MGGSRVTTCRKKKKALKSNFERHSTVMSLIKQLQLDAAVPLSVDKLSGVTQSTGEERSCSQIGERLASNSRRLLESLQNDSEGL